MKTRKDATAAVAAGSYFHDCMASYKLGEPADAAALVAVADAAVAASPSVGSRNLRREALQFAAHLELMAADPAYKTEAEKTRRTLGYELFDMALASPGPLGKQAAAIGKAYLAQVAENAKAMPNHFGAVSGYLLRDSHPEIVAANQAARVKNPVSELANDLSRVLSPLGSEAVKSAWFRMMLNGKPDEAKKLWLPLEAKGVPVPKLPE